MSNLLKSIPLFSSKKSIILNKGSSPVKFNNNDFSSMIPSKLVKYINLTFQSLFSWTFMWTDGQVKGKVLHKLARKGKFEHSHTALENLQGGFPPDLRGKAKDISEELIKEGILH